MNEHSARLRARLPARKRTKVSAGVSDPPQRRRVEFLLIDISNSFTKIAWATRRKLGAVQRVQTPQLSPGRLRQILEKHPVQRIVVSSVVPAKSRVIAAAAGKREVIWLTAKSRLNVRIDYPKPRTIGADRLANAVAVTELHGTPAIVIDFGTAVTFDIVSADAAYIGGVIAPGLEAMTNFLYHRTALLPRISLREPPSAIGKTTRDAMRAGAIFGYRGLVQEILRRITAEKFRKKRVHVVATGGYANLVAKKLPQVEEVHENLTLEGLRIVGCLNLKEGAPVTLSEG
jgi:type III pantothenate kinase